MPIRHIKSQSEDWIGGVRRRNNMETIWLQRSSPDIPWGFRMVGGQEFGLPLTIQRVTPGSVAAAGLGPGDVILKVGNVMATNLEHSDAHELVKQAGNILQLTIKKPDGPLSPGPISPSRPGYGNQLSIQINDYNAVPKGFGTGIPIKDSYGSNNASPNYATIPRNFGSQHQPLQATIIDIQKVNPAQQRSGYNSCNGDENADSGGISFPDYTLAYKKQEPVHDSPGGPDNIRGYIPPSENTSYSTKSLPRGVGRYQSSDMDRLGGVGGPPAYEQRSQDGSLNSLSPGGSVVVKFNTGLSFQSSPVVSQQPFASTAAQSYQPTSNSAQPSFSSVPRPFSPPTSSGPLSPRNQTSSVSELAGREQSTSAGNLYSQTPSYQSESSSFDHSNIHGSGNNTYSTLPHSKPSYTTNNNNSFNIYKSTPQPYFAPKPFVPAQAATSATFNQSALPFTSSQPRQFQSMDSSGSSSGYSSSQPVVRKVSFDQNAEENGTYAPKTNFTARPFKPLQPTTAATFSGHAYNLSTVQQDDTRAPDFGVPTPQLASFSQQSSKPQDVYTAVPYTPPGGPISPRSEFGSDYDGNRYDPSGINVGMNSLNLDSQRYELPQSASSAPALPPPPPPPGPPPPPPPPLNEWNPTPYRRQNYQQNDESEEQKVPDQLLSAVLMSTKGGGPKPFSYGIDLSELKKKIGPPTAPKPRQDQGQVEEPEAPRQYNGPPKRSAGQVQSDYYVKRDDNVDPTFKVPKKPAGQVQSDYFMSRQTGPRSEIDESPININMGTDPKKQSKSFKVLQWMTETEQDGPEGSKMAGREPSQKPRRTKDPERRHNADDDEMRFSGLHSKAEIPSKTFGILQRISSHDGSAPVQNGKATLDVGDTDEGKENYEDTAMRYKGRNIPSPSFRLLQTWAELDPDPNINTTDSKKEEGDSNDFQETANSDEVVDKRYKGGNIPSKVFKALQKTLGDDTSEPNNNQSEDAQSDVAAISEF